MSFSEQDCIEALRRAAARLPSETRSKRAYERVRRGMERRLPSTTTIETCCGSWRDACVSAGLRRPPVSQPTSSQRAQMLEDLRAAWWATEGTFHLWRYAAWREELPAPERRRRHEAPAIVYECGSWANAVREAGIRPVDAFAPSAAASANSIETMWTVGDARRLVRSYFATQRRLPSAESWHPKPGYLPSWEVLCELLPPPPWPDLRTTSCRTASTASAGARRRREG